jgi:non-heme chloroperoxidase
MNTITIKDDTKIYYKGWGTGQPVVFSHGGSLNAYAWESQMVYLASNGYRCIAHDRRVNGRSGQSWNGITLVGHSSSGGEVVRYIGRDSIKHFAKVVLIGAVMRLAAIVTRRKRM